MCNYCKPETEDAPYGERMQTDYEKLSVKVDGLNGYLSIYGSKDYDMVLINYCPMCGKDISESH